MEDDEGEVSLEQDGNSDTEPDSDTELDPSQGTRFDAIRQRLKFKQPRRPRNRNYSEVANAIIALCPRHTMTRECKDDIVAPAHQVFELARHAKGDSQLALTYGALEAQRNKPYRHVLLLKCDSVAKLLLYPWARPAPVRGAFNVDLSRVVLTRELFAYCYRHQHFTEERKDHYV